MNHTGRKQKQKEIMTAAQRQDAPSREFQKLKE